MEFTGLDMTHGVDNEATRPDVRYVWRHERREMI